MFEMICLTLVLVVAGSLFVICIIEEHVLCIREGKPLESFDERFPPISDVEFLARCTPRTNPRVALRVRRIVADQLGIEYDRIYPSSRFVDDLGVD